MSLSPLSSAYSDRCLALLATARENNAATIAALAPILGASVARGEVIHTFGSGHSEIIAREIVGRAGGLVCITAINDPTAGFIENLVGYGTKLVERYDRQYELRAGEVVSRAEIWEQLYDFNQDPESNVVDVFVAYLRRKIEREGKPKLIHTRRGMGYILEERAEA